MACPICKKLRKNFSIRVKDYEYNVDRSAIYNQCKSCKSIYRSKPKKILKRWKDIYSKKNYLPIKGNIIYDYLKGIYAKYEKSRIINILDKNYFIRKRTILDIACGKGYLIKKFSKNENLKCIGIDANIKTKKDDNTKFIKSSFDNLGLIKKINPDIIILNNFIEHIENLQKINKIISSMKKKSYLIIITPDSNSNARQKFSNYWSGFHSPRHKTIFSEKSIRIFFKKYKKISYRQCKIFDPFSNLVSILNNIKRISLRYFFIDVLRAFNFIFYIFIDINNKNRLFITIKKK